MAALDPFVLPPEVVIQPMARVPSELREQIEHRPGDYAVTRPRSRARSSVVDARTAALLEAFRTPSTIVDAVIAVSAAEGLDPRATLDDAFAVLRGFVDQGLLVAADSELARPITTSLEPGDRVGAFEVEEPAQVLVDTEVYRARAGDGSAVALKLARPGTDERLRAALAHEAAILDHLDGRVSPRLLELGELDGRPFLAVSWCRGVDVHQAAAEARQLGEPAGRPALLGLAEQVIAAYAHLHAQGVLHGDVHPRNLLVGADGRVTVIDFGFAARPAAGGAPSAGGRGGVDLFLDPQTAAAALAGHPPPPLSAPGEQYSLGALLYLLLTGAHTHAFSLEQEEMLQQLLEQPPLPFDRHRAWAMPAVERVVARALAKDPDARHLSVADLWRAFRAAAARDRRPAGTATRPEPARRLLDDVMGRLVVPGELFASGLAAPTASAMHGGAGLAYALLRLAEIRGDEALLAAADLWSTRAASAVGSSEAFWSPQLELVPEAFDAGSFYHHAAGVHCVQALVAGARGDDRAQRLAVASFVASAAGPCRQVDVAFGRAGLLLGCALTLESLLPATGAERLRALGDILRDSLWSELDGQPPLTEGTERRLLGAAHGWAGYLYAVLRWSEASATPPPAGLDERLEQLAALGRPVGRGLRWPVEPGAAAPDAELAASWCNGAAGYAQLWTLAHRRLSEERYWQLAQLAAWSAYEGGSAAPGDLCCGFAGRAYALLGLFRHSGEAAWLARASRLAELAATRVRAGSLRRDSLYKGEVGVALLAADVQAPEHARMPLFESEG